MPDTPTLVCGIDIEALRAAAKNDDEHNEITGWTPASVDDTDPRMATAVEDAYEMLIRADFRSVSGETRLLTLARKLDVEVEAADIPEPAETFVLALSPFGAQVIRAALTLVRDDEQVATVTDLITDGFTESADEERVESVLHAILAEIEGRL